MKRVLVAGGLLTLGVAATGCGDSDDPKGGGDMDGGASDGGPKADAKADTGTKQDTGTDEEGIECSAEAAECTGITLLSMPIGACCTGDGKCGIDTDDIKMVNDMSPLTGCFQKDLPGVPSDVHCGAFLDELQPAGGVAGNRGIDLPSAAGTLTFGGCCTPAGECGAQLNAPKDAEGATLTAFDIHLGCVGFRQLAAALGGGGGEAPTPTILPFCNPTTGEALTEGTIPGAPKFVCGCGVGNTDPGTGLPCLNNLPATVCGADEPTAEQLGKLPEFYCGEQNAPADGLPKLRNLPYTTCGTKAITADSAELAAVPEFICGAEGATANGLPMLKNVESTVCGKKEITDASPDLAGVPAFICGAEGNPDPNLPKLANVPASVCGKEAVAAGSPRLANIPEFLCGCTGRQDPKLGCLRNVANDVCGALAVDATYPRLAGIPKFVCGCGATTIDSELRSLCMSNVETTVCGTRPDAVTDQGAAGPSLEDCLTGVPKFAIGCGPAEPPPGSSCLRQTPQRFGCDVPTAPVRRVPEFLCGCGVSATDASGRPDQGLPCLPLTVETTCGALPITAQAQLPATLPNNLCGCGDNVTTTAAQCLDNVPGSICGATPVCSPIGAVGTAPCAAGQMCVDGRGGANSGAGGVGGAGDGIGDTCVTPP